jgi:uroporphyrinogen-III synthase
MNDSRPLTGLRVLVPRGGGIGARLSAAVERAGGVAAVAPVIDFAPPGDPRGLSEALSRLSAGRYDWLAVTSATTAEALTATRVPGTTRVAAVGDATAHALAEQGISVDFIPTSAHTAEAMVLEWPSPTGRVLIPQSAIAEPTLARGLEASGMTVEVVTAYETRTVPLDPTVAEQLKTGGFAAVLATSGSVVRALAVHCSPFPPQTTLACIGESTANAARAAGLHVDVVARTSSAESLVEALVRVHRTER